jgi:hypothetical protein
MLKKVTVIALALVFLNYTFGCAYKTSHRVSKEEIRSREMILEVILPSGEVFDFDESGATLLPQGQAVAGVNSKGDTITIPVSAVSEFRTMVPKSVSIEEVTNFDGQIEEVILKDGTRIEFKDKKFRYNKKMDRLEGKVMSKNKAFVQKGLFVKGKRIKLDMIEYIRITKPATTTRKELLQNSEQRLAEVVDFYDSVITFDSNGGKLVTSPPVFIGTIGGRRVQFNMDDVLYVKVRRVDPVASTITTSLGVLALLFVGAALVIAATKESCPFVYSYDGEHYIFDAEPLGGAISKGLEKTDYSRLEHLKPVKDKYHLMMRNEVEEIQYLDEVRLVIVDHEPGTQIVPNLLGNLVQIRKPLSPVSATDEKGMNLMNFVKERDEIVWQTHLPTDDSFRDQDVRQHLTFEFPKPANARRAKLIVNAGTALWGSNMIREMLEMRGNNVGEWYEGIDSGGPQLEELQDFIAREELYLLKM